MCICQYSITIQECQESLTIGVLPFDTEVFVYVKNITTGYVHKYVTTTDEAGYAIIDTAQPTGLFSPSFTYELTATSEEGSVDIEINEDLTVKCITIQVESINSETND